MTEQEVVDRGYVCYLNRWDSWPAKGLLRALTLAEYLFGDKKRVRFDMSELGYPGSALRLVDGPDGQGELTRAIREQPFSVVLFDEIEKADSGV